MTQAYGVFPLFVLLGNPQNNIHTYITYFSDFTRVYSLGKCIVTTQLVLGQTIKPFITRYFTFITVHHYSQSPTLFLNCPDSRISCLPLPASAGRYCGAAPDWCAQSVTQLHKEALWTLEWTNTNAYAYFSTPQSCLLLGLFLLF